MLTCAAAGEEVQLAGCSPLEKVKEKDDKQALAGVYVCVPYLPSPVDTQYGWDVDKEKARSLKDELRSNPIR